MMIPISEDINTEEELGTMNLEAPVYECYSHGAAFGVRLPSGEQTAALFADIRAARPLRTILPRWNLRRSICPA